MMEWIIAILVVWCAIATGLLFSYHERLDVANAEIKSLLDKLSHREGYIKSLCSEIECLKKPIPYATTWYRDGQGFVTEAIPKGEDIAGTLKPFAYSGQLAVKTDKGIRMNESYVKPVYRQARSLSVAKNGSGHIMASDSGPVLNLDNWDFVSGFAASDSDSKKPVVSDVFESTPSYGSIVEVNDCSSSYDAGSGSCDSIGGND